MWGHRTKTAGRRAPPEDRAAELNMKPDKKPKHESSNSSNEVAEIRLARRSPEHWRVTVDHPPLNLFGPEMLSQVNEIITALEN